MERHDEFRELCAASTAGDLTDEERKRLEAHLSDCPSCREALKGYESVIQKAIPALAIDFPKEDKTDSSSWTLEGAEARFFERLDEQKRSGETHTDTPVIGSTDDSEIRRHSSSFGPSAALWGQVWLSYAAGIILFVALGIVAYRTGIRRGVDVARETPVQHETGIESLQAQLSDVGHEKMQISTQLEARDRTIADLKREFEEQSLELKNLKVSLNATGKIPARPEEASQKGGETERVAAREAGLQELQKRLDAQEQQRSEEAAQAKSLETKVSELTQIVRDRDRTISEQSHLLRDREATIDEQQAANQQQKDLLSHDRDIRELMGARDLYIAEVHDVNAKNQTSKPYGRVFYTKEKSLIFYAYDLDQQAGLKDASYFQAWGRRGPDKQLALNLGVFYEDNISKKRWVLKFNDAKTLAQIDAVFVTVEPKEGNSHPSGKQLLFAYLRVNPNHP